MKKKRGIAKNHRKIANWRDMQKKFRKQSHGKHHDYFRKPQALLFSHTFLSTTTSDPISNSWSVDDSGIYTPHQGTELRASNNQTEAEGIHRSWGLHGKESCMAFTVVPELKWLNPNARSEPGHFLETKTALRVLSGIAVGGYCLESAIPDKWLLCWCDQELGENESDCGAKNGLSRQVWTRMTGNTRVIHPTIGRWQYDRYECNAVKEKGDEASKPMPLLWQKLAFAGNSHLIRINLD